MMFSLADVLLVSMLSFMVGSYLTSEFIMGVTKRHLHRSHVAETPDGDPRE